MSVSDCHFDYGTSVFYDSSAPCSPSPGSGTSAVDVSASLEGLSASTTYHFRIVATNAGGTSFGSDATFTTPPPPPVVSSIAPGGGPQAGGTVVTVSGSNLAPANAVKFGSTPAASFSVSSGTSLTATAPAGTGTVDVTVTTGGGTSATGPSDRFTYLARPAVAKVSPTSGGTEGGTSVTITGSSFSGASAVAFGSVTQVNW